MFPEPGRTISHLLVEIVLNLIEDCTGIGELLIEPLDIYIYLKIFLLNTLCEFIYLIINLIPDDIKVSLDLIEVIIDNTEGFTNPREVRNLLNLLNPIREGGNCLIDLLNP